MAGVPAPVAYPTKDEFELLNKRLWAWFLSRISGKITDGIPYHVDLYQLQGGIDYFDDDHAFIEVIFKKTGAFLKSADRHLVVERAITVINAYKDMMDLIYKTLSADDFNEFLNQVPASNLSTFFNKIPQIFSDKHNIAQITAGTTLLRLNAWKDELFPLEITRELHSAGGAAAFNRPGPGLLPPLAGIDAKLAPIWHDLVNLAQTIDEQKAEMEKSIARIP
jgi:hypothetical protein